MQRRTNQELVWFARRYASSISSNNGGSSGSGVAPATAATAVTSTSASVSAATESLQALLQRRLQPESSVNNVNDGSSNINISLHPTSINGSSSNTITDVATRPNGSASTIPPSFNQNQHRQSQNQPNAASQRGGMAPNVPSGPHQWRTPSTNSRLQAPMGGYNNGNNRLREQLAQIAQQRTSTFQNNVNTNATTTFSQSQRFRPGTMSAAAPGMAGSNNAPPNSNAADASGSIMQSLSKLREQFLANKNQQQQQQQQQRPSLNQLAAAPSKAGVVSRFSVPPPHHRNTNSMRTQPPLNPQGLSFQQLQQQQSSQNGGTNYQRGNSNNNVANDNSQWQLHNQRDRALFQQRRQWQHQQSSQQQQQHRPRYPNQSQQQQQQSQHYTSPFSVPDMPLSDIIRSMQLQNSAALRQSTAQPPSLHDMNENADADAAAATATPFDVLHPPRPDVIPKWRQPGLLQNNRMPPPHERENHNTYQSSSPRVSSNAITTKQRHRPVFVDPKLQTIVLPSFEISLSEASSLFRTKTSTLVDMLRSMGEDKPGVSDEAWMISPDALGMLALELGLTFENAIAKNGMRDDEALLLSRRAASSELDTAEASTDTTMESSSLFSYESYPHRPPVVCIMGHVDHGKTTLMDALRRRAAGEETGKKKKSKDKKREKGTKRPKHPGDVAGTEAGGITQVISAFQVPLDNDNSNSSAVTFLDTPGHAAFTAMRQSGSDAADIIVLVVAADDGVSEQTIEILDFYKSIVKDAGSGGISLVVAMNKIDKPGVEVEESTLRIQSQLLEHGILTEGMPMDSASDYGPAVQMIPVSGLTGAGLDDLIEGISLQSEIMDLRAPIETRAEGIVMDARVDKGVGIVADCIVRWGSIQKGDIVVSGTSKGKVRLLKDPTNAPLKVGLPSQPVRIIGFDEAPKAGDPIVCVESEQVADDLVARRRAAADSSEETGSTHAQSLELQSSGRHMMRHEWKEALEKKYGMDPSLDANGVGIEDGLVRIPVLIKADADGTLAAIRDSLLQIGSETSYNIVIEPVKLAVGPVLATEVQIAKECNAAIVCFNLKNEQVITTLAEESGVSILRSDVIYTLLDEAKVEFAKYLAPEPVEVIHGRGKVQAVFTIGGKVEKVAGLIVQEGTLFKAKVKATKDSPVSKAVTCQYRVVRGDTTVVDALAATSLKHFKEDVEEVGRGKECGISLTGHDDYEKDDEIQCFSIQMKHPTL